MADGDGIELAPGSGLTDDELQLLENLRGGFGRNVVNFDGCPYLVTVELHPHFIIFCATNIRNGEFLSFNYNPGRKAFSVFRGGIDVSWIKAFLNGYRMVED